LLGHHAQTRKLKTNNHIVVPADPTKSYGEAEFVLWLQSIGYTVEYQYESVKQA